MEPPKAVVHKPGERRLKKRIGRGYSIGELREAGIDIKMARKLGIYVDKRRKTIYKENVENLKKYLEEIRRQ